MRDDKLLYADHCYNIVAIDAVGLDSLYEDYIIELVGVRGLESLIEARCLETCGKVHGRQLYALVTRK